mgnify:CR=1 FL=1
MEAPFGDPASDRSRASLGDANSRFTRPWIAHFVGLKTLSCRVQDGIDVTAQYTPLTSVKNVANWSVIWRMSCSWILEHAKMRPTAPTRGVTSRRTRS